MGLELREMREKDVWTGNGWNQTEGMHTHMKNMELEFESVNEYVYFKNNK